MIKRALITVSDKEGLAEFARGLAALSVEIISTGGTADFLRKNGIAVKEVSEFTNSPEILDGRVKTIHPKIAGGILSIRTSPGHQKECKENGIVPIDMVVVNLYPFEKTVARPDATFEEAIENIDIGGPTLVRAAAKNHRFVAVVTNPKDYPKILEEMRASNGALGDKTRLRLTRQAFALTSRYDTAISNYLETTDSDSPFPTTITLCLKKKQDLRYGENPHQRGALYEFGENQKTALPNAEQLHGKELSFNNFLDLEGALNLTAEFEDIACVIIKHSNPAGVAISKISVEDAFEKALVCDPVSAFGGIISVNRTVTERLAELVHRDFYEVVVAPAFDPKALEILTKKKNIRLLRLPIRTKDDEKERWDIRKISGGFLVQDHDTNTTDLRKCQVPTRRRPTDMEWEALSFNWKVVKHVKSNAIVLGSFDRTIGIGAGQMSRIDSTRMAILKAQSPLEGAVMASDAFFPFPDSINEVAKVGVGAVVQPGGSIKDDEVIKAADDLGLAMVLAGLRHFRH